MGEIILRPTPPAPLHFTGERLTTDYGGQTEIEHLHRYLLAREWCRGKHVLDVASGEGYGTALLAQVAASAVGVEIARDAVDHAANAYQSENLRYVAGDARAIPAEDQAFDVVVSFETIEHFAEQGQFLAEVRRVLRPGGLFIVSTPDRDNYSPAETPANPYHVQELTEAEFDTLLRDRFAHVAIVAQRPMFGSVMLPPGAGGAAPICFERRGDQHFEGSAGLARPQYLIAFASDVAAPALPPSIYIDTGRLGMVSPPVAEARLNALHAALEHERRQAAATLEETCTRRDADTAAQTQHLGGQIARLESALQDSQAQIEASLAAIRLRGDELHATQLDLAAARGEAKGLVAASEMAERAGGDHARGIGNRQPVRLGRPRRTLAGEPGARIDAAGGGPHPRRAERRRGPRARADRRVAGGPGPGVPRRGPRKRRNGLRVLAPDRAGARHQPPSVAPALGPTQ